MSLHLPCSSIVMDCSVHITSHVFTASRTLANQNMEIAFSFFQLLNIHLQYIYIQECDFYIILMVLIGTPMFAASQPNPAKRYVLKKTEYIAGTRRLSTPFSLIFCWPWIKCWKLRVIPGSIHQNSIILISWTRCWRWRVITWFTEPYYFALQHDLGSFRGLSSILSLLFFIFILQVTTSTFGLQSSCHQ